MNRFPAIGLVAVPLLVALGACESAAAPWMVSDAGGGSFRLEAGASGAAELSGLTWVGGSSYYAVSDQAPAMYPISIDLDLATGRIRAASVSSALPLVGSDLEGIAFVAPDRVLVSDESGPGLRVHSLAGGSLLQSPSLPSVLASIRPNLSLEALAWDVHGGFVWTANEEALTVDGAVSGFTTGSAVRLFRLDAGFAPAGQWVYVTDPIPGDRPPSGRDIELSGVSDLAALEDGTLLVLERALGQGIYLRHRIYEVDFTGATEVTALAGLEGASWVPVSKTLLWQRDALATNFEGMTLGPTLADGSRSLVLVSDDGGGLVPSLLALKVRPRVCGDGIVGRPETCDDGNVVGGDGCSAECAQESCGDGIVNNGGIEACDDGNAADGDGCTASCAIEKDAAACRRALARAGIAYLNARLAAESNCRNRLNRGDALVWAADGLTPVTAPAQCALEQGTAAALARAGLKMRRVVEKKCAALRIAVVGACGETLDDTIGPLGVGGCLPATHAAAVENWLEAAFAETLSPEQAALRACQETVARAGRSYLLTALRAVQGCRNALDAGKKLFSDAAGQVALLDRRECTREYRAAERVARAGDKLRSALGARCDDALVESLGTSCAQTLDGLVAPSGDEGCLVGATGQAVAASILAQFGP